MAFDSRRPHLFVNTADRPALGIWYVLGREAQLTHAAHLEADQFGASSGTPNSAVDVMRSFRQG